MAQDHAAEQIAGTIDIDGHHPATRSQCEISTDAYPWCCVNRVARGACGLLWQERRIHLKHRAERAGSFCWLPHNLRIIVRPASPSIPPHASGTNPCRTRECAYIDCRWTRRMRQSTWSLPSNRTEGPRIGRSIYAYVAAVHRRSQSLRLAGRRAGKPSASPPIAGDVDRPPRVGIDRGIAEGRCKFAARPICRPRFDGSGIRCEERHPQRRFSCSATNPGTFACISRMMAGTSTRACRDVRRMPMKATITGFAIWPFRSLPRFVRPFAERALPEALTLAPSTMSSGRPSDTIGMSGPIFLSSPAR